MNAPGKKRLVVAVARWVGPFLLSAMATAFIGWGSVQYAKGTDATRLSTVERDVREAKAEHEKYVTRDEFGLMRDDIGEIKKDMRQIRESLSKKD